MPLVTPQAGSFQPQIQSPSPQSQYLAQALAAMSAQPPRTAIGAGANAVASVLNQINDPSNPPIWTNPLNGQPSNNWMNSPIGRAAGGLFGLGQTAQSLNNASSAIASGGAMPPAF